MWWRLFGLLMVAMLFQNEPDKDSASVATEPVLFADELDSTLLPFAEGRMSQTTFVLVLLWWKQMNPTTSFSLLRLFSSWTLQP